MPARKMNLGNPWKILIALAVIGVISVFFTTDILGVCVLMLLSYISNASYSMVSRSAVRDSILYHAFTTLLSNVVFYEVLKILVADNMTLALFIPYTVATVYGSFTGAKASQWVEERFGIVTDPSKKQETPQSKLAKKLVLVLVGTMGIVVGFLSRNLVAALLIAGLAFGDNVTFSLVRRSRNTSNTTYHIIAFLVKSLAWYMLFSSLSVKGMPFGLFAPYCFGSVLGGITGQGISAWIEKKIGATADAHLTYDMPWYGFIPWKSTAILSGMVVLYLTVLMFIKPLDSGFLAYLAVLSAGQQVAFSLVSRSRQRNNMAYHVIASIFSNGVWFLTFRQLQVKQWTAELFTPYALGGTIGSVTGVGISMGIENKLGISSDSHITKVRAKSTLAPVPNNMPEAKETR